MILVAGLVVALGALVQGAVGYGMALVAAPLLALLDPALVPVPLIVLSAGHSRQVTSAALISSAELAPFLLAGFVLSGPARHVLDRGRTRHAVLTVAAASAGLLVGRSLL